MKGYENFKVAAYVFAYYLAEASEEEILQGIEFFKNSIHLDKVYLENHRSVVDIPVEKMRKVKKLFNDNGIETSGGITSTVLVDGKRKPALFDSFCYTDPAHRQKYLQVVRELASVFDEIILDDFFFTSCRCEMCIEAKGKMTWKDYRLKLMEGFSKEIVDLAKSVNPNVNFIIKYPNWYESYQETGYNPGKQKDIFDMVYAGTETREPFYCAQHLQRYESYSIIRLFENTAPGRNGGGWIDPWGSWDNINHFLEQADLTFYAKAKEIMLFNFTHLLDTAMLPALGQRLKRTDKMVSKMGNPIGVSAWEPFDADGEDQVYNYLGMGGTAIEPSPYFDENASSILLTQSSAYAPDAMEKLEAYVRKGGNAVITVGFLREMYDKGIKDMTSVRLTHRHVMGQEYMIDNANYTNTHCAKADEPAMFEILDYKTNATWADILLLAGENNFPVMTEDNYGKGRLFVLNVPEDFADLYKLPKEVWRSINKHISMGQRVYIAGDSKCSFFAYDNNVYGIQSYSAKEENYQVIIRGECKGIRDLETGKVYSEKLTLFVPDKRQDAATVIDEPVEYVFEIPVSRGQDIFFEVL